MKINIKRLILYILLILFVFMVFPFSKISNVSILEFIMLSIIGIISIFEIVNSCKENGFSLNIIFWLFNLIFLSIAPFLQIANQVYMWETRHNEMEIVFNCIVILIWIAFYKLGRKTNNKINIKNEENMSYYLNNNTFKKIILLLISSIFSFILIRNIGFNNMFSRNTTVFSISSNSAINLLVEYLLRSTITFSATFMLYDFMSNKKNFILCFLSIILLLITNFPTSLARNTAGVIYLGIFVIYNYKDHIKFKKSINYVCTFLLVLMIVFPLINVFRTLKFSEVNILTKFRSVVSDISADYLTENYDAFDMGINASNYVKRFGSTNGKQLLGVVLFWVPRSVWASKPVGSGKMIFEAYNYQFTNVSCPLYAEGYVNFGILGVAVLAFIVGKIVKYIDTKYNLLTNKNKINLGDSSLLLLYPFLLPAFFFMLRGDLLSSFAYMVGFSAPYIILYRFVVGNVKLK